MLYFRTTILFNSIFRHIVFLRASATFIAVVFVNKEEIMSWKTLSYNITHLSQQNNFLSLPVSIVL